MSEREDLFRELLDRNYSRWMGIARCYAAPHAWEDLVQEISLHVWKSLDGFAGRSHIDTWAYRVALNTALAWDRDVRSREKRIERIQGDVSALIGGVTDATREERVLAEFLVSLSKMDRAAMLLYLENVPTEEASEVLGLTEGALRVRMHRIRKRFEATYCEPVKTK